MDAATALTPPPPPPGVCIRVDGADHTPAAAVHVLMLEQTTGVVLDASTDDADGAAFMTMRWIARVGAVPITSGERELHPHAMQLALASAFHWVLANVTSIAVEIYDDGLGAWVSFDATSLLSEVYLASPLSMHVLSTEEETVRALVSETTKVVDARCLEQYLGLDSNQQVVGHLEGSVSVPYDTVFDDDQGTFLTSEDLIKEFEASGVCFTSATVVVGSTVSEASSVATALILAGHTAVQLSLVMLVDELMVRLPVEMTDSVFKKGELLFVSDEGTVDLSPNAVPMSTQADATKDDAQNLLEKEYVERLKKPTGSPDDAQALNGADSDNEKTQQVVWLNPVGQRYFDMPSHLSKPSFIEASRDIYRVVSFVLAPFGFPSELQERFSVSEVKFRCSALYQDVIEVCSDLVYHHRGLNEGAMAMSVHRWVETLRDPECSQQVRAINDLVDVLYKSPTFVEVPQLTEEQVMEIAKEMEIRLTEAIEKRAPWALETSEGEEKLLASPKESQDDPVLDGHQSSGWKQCTYPSVVYALGYTPPEPKKKHQRLSTLQIKSFIQAAAEAIWAVINEEPCSQVEYQALCDTIGNEEKRALLASIKERAERALYIVKHSLLQSLEREADVVDTLVAVRDITEDGNRAYRSGRYEVALSCFTNALFKLPVFHAEVAPVLVGRIKCHIQLGHLDQATRESNVLLKIDPFSVGAYTCLGEINEKLSCSEQAMQHYVTAFILDGSRSPDHASAIDRVSRSVGRNVAKDIFKDMVLQHELPTQWLVDSYFDAFEHDVDCAARVPSDIAKSLEMDHTELQAERLLSRAVFLKRKKQYKNAQADLRAVLSKELEDEALRAMALNLHASFLYVAGDVHAAIKAIDESLALCPTSVNGLVKKGGFLAEVGDMEEASTCFDQAAEIDPNDADVYLHMGQKELLQGNYYEAVQCLRRSMSRSEALPVTHVSYGMALYKSGSIYQSLDVFEEAAKLFPESPEVHLFYGEVLADQGDYASAMRHFLRALELSPQCPLPFLNAGRVYVSTNDPMRAIAHFQQALDIDPRCSSAHLDIAQVLFAQGRAAEAFHHFDCAARCCRFLPEVEEVCSAQEMARMQESVTDILGVDLRHIMRSK